MSSTRLKPLALFVLVATLNVPVFAAGMSAGNDCGPTPPAFDHAPPQARGFEVPAWVRERRAQRPLMPNRADMTPPEPPSWVSELQQDMPPMPDFGQMPGMPDWGGQPGMNMPAAPQPPAQTFEPPAMPETMMQPPEWVTEAPARPEMPQWNADRPQPPQHPEWITERPPRPEMPEWVTQRQAERPEPPKRPAWITERRTELPQRPELPEWVQERRDQMAAGPKPRGEIIEREINRPGLRGWTHERREFTPRPHGFTDRFEYSSRSHHFPRHADPQHAAPQAAPGNDGTIPLARPMPSFENGPMRMPFPRMGRFPFGHRGFGFPGPRFPMFNRPMMDFGGYQPGNCAPQAMPMPQPPVEQAAPPQANAPAPAPAPEPKLVDADADGVLDTSDLCPGTAAGAQVDLFGCATEARIVLRGVNFKTDSDELTSESVAILERVATTLVANPQVRVEVAGHTDTDADAAYNKDLSQRRAEQVKAFLVQKGVDTSNLEAKGYGEEQPMVANDSAANKAKNRRVELKRLADMRPPMAGKDEAEQAEATATETSTTEVALAVEAGTEAQQEAASTAPEATPAVQVEVETPATPVTDTEIVVEVPATAVE